MRPKADVHRLETIGRYITRVPLTQKSTHAPYTKICTLSPLMGLSSTQIQDALGEPDVVDVRTAIWSYFFTSPLPSGQRGGGHPELSFTFSRGERVTNVSCHYAR